MLEDTAESDLSKVAPETLLQSLSVTGNFLEILQEFQEFSIQEIPLIIVSQAYKSRRYVCDGGMIFLLSFDYNFNFSRIPRGKVSVARQIRGE